MRIRFFLILLLSLSPSFVSAKDIIVYGEKVDGKLVVNQSQFLEPNSNYVIKKAFDLNGMQLFLPENSKLTFKCRGKLLNGTLVGSETDLSAGKNKTVFSKIEITGTWSVRDIYSSWFDFGEDAAWNTKYMQNLSNLTSDNHLGNIYISEGVYKINVANEASSCMYIHSNTNLTIDGTIELQPCDKRFYGIVRIVDVHDVLINGKGKIVGDVVNHIGDDGQWGMGIDVWSSKNVEIKDITVKNCWGDCIYVGQSKEVKESFPEDIIIDNVTCTASRRQGLSIIAGKNILVKNSRFTDIGSIKFTPPGAGLDIEPNHYGETVLDNVVISNCVFRNNHDGKDFSSFNIDKTASVFFSNCTFEGRLVMHDKVYNITFERCDINDFYINRQNTGNIVFKNSKIHNTPPQHLLLKNIIKLEDCEYPKNNNVVFFLIILLLIGIVILVLKKKGRGMQ